MNAQIKTPYCLILLISLPLLFCSCTGTDKKTTPEVADIISKIDGEPVVPRRANTIYINPFANLTGNSIITDKLMKRVRESINRERRLAVTASPETADLLLMGRVTGFEIQNKEFNPMGIPEKKRMRITASIKLIEREGMRLIFVENGIQAFLEYSDTVPPIKQESMALEDVVLELSRRITSKTITGWYTERMTPVEKGKR